MKIHAVSFESNTHFNETESQNGNLISPFFYTRNTDTKNKEFKKNSYKLFTALLAAAAVTVTLLNLSGKKQFPKNIVEINDKNTGLNRIRKHQRTVQELKDAVLYPLMATIKGDKNFIKSKDFKSGIVIGGKNNSEVRTVVEAFCEHVKALGIKCVDNMPASIKKSERKKWVYKALREAQDNYSKTKKYTVVNIGNINLLADFKSAKSTTSNLEEFLMAVNKQTYPGVLWIAWKNNADSLPYFFNDMPVLITRIMD